MARLDLNDLPEGRREIVVTLSDDNLLALLHKLSMPGSRRELRSDVCYRNGRLAPHPGLQLVLHPRHDDECAKALEVAGSAEGGIDELVVLTLPERTLRSLLDCFRASGSALLAPHGAAAEGPLRARVRVESAVEHDARELVESGARPGPLHRDTAAYVGERR